MAWIQAIGYNKLGPEEYICKCDGGKSVERAG